MFGKTWFFYANVQNMKKCIDKWAFLWYNMDRMIVCLVCQRGSFNGMGKMYLSDLRRRCARV